MTRVRGSSSGGKKLESEMLQSLKQVKEAWAQRLNDKVFIIYTPRGPLPAKSPSEADLLLVGKRVNLLLECKEVTGPSIPFRRLESHQLQAGLDFEKRGRRFKAYVIVQYLKIKDEKYLCLAIPFQRWRKEERLSDRKSLNYARALEIGLRLPRIKGSMWGVKKLLRL